MSRAAARAMRDLAECIDEEAEELGAGTVYGVAKLLARAHHKAADRIERWSEQPDIPPEYRGGAGQKPTARDDRR